MCVHVLELRLECLGVLKEWQKVVFLGAGIAAALPESAQIRFWLACGLAQGPPKAGGGTGRGSKA